MAGFEVERQLAVAAPGGAELRHRQGRLLGRMDGLGFRFRAEATLTTLTADVIKSSAIEGERLDAEEVRSSIARRLGMDFGATKVAGRNLEGVVEMMPFATNKTKRDRMARWMGERSTRALAALGVADHHRRSTREVSLGDIAPPQVPRKSA